MAKKVIKYAKASREGRTGATSLNVRFSPYDWEVGGRESDVVKKLKLRNDDAVKITIEVNKRA